MTIDEKIIQMKVIGKSETTKGVLFKRQEYLVAFQVVDERSKTNPTQERKVPFHQYSAINIGDVIGVHLYSSDKEMWFFSEEEARIYQTRKNR